MQKSLQKNLDDRIDDLSSRLFGMFEQRLFQGPGRNHQQGDSEKHLPIKEKSERRTPHKKDDLNDKPPRFSIEGYGSVPVDQLISALKNINGDSVSRPKNRRFIASDEKYDEDELEHYSQSRRQGRKSTSGRANHKSIAPCQVEEVSTADANHALTDPMYHDLRNDTRKGVWSRRVGLSKSGVKILIPANGKFASLMDYRYYRIPDPDDYNGRYLRSRGVRNIGTLESHMSETRFSGHPPTLVFDFLDRYRDECIGIDLSEIEAHLYLGDFLDGAAKQLYNLITVADRFDTSVVGWCTKVNWLLSKFATD